mgnify:CR=1 FL=1
MMIYQVWLDEGSELLAQFSSMKEAKKEIKRLKGWLSYQFCAFQIKEVEYSGLSLIVNNGRVKIKTFLSVRPNYNSSAESNANETDGMRQLRANMAAFNKRSAKTNQEQIDRARKGKRLPGS